MTSTVSVVLHGWPWPHESRTTRARLAIDAVLPGAQPLEARAAGKMVQAAAVVHQAITSSSGSVLIVADANQDLDSNVLAALAARVESTGGLVLAGTMDTGSELACVSDGDTDEDLVEVLLKDLAGPAEALRTGPRDPSLWGCARVAYESLGGLDPELWHIGAVADLEIRARAAGLPVSRVDGTGGAAFESWPLDVEAETLLGIRNRLIVALKALQRSPEGSAARETWCREVARTTAAAISEAWRASGVDATQLRFGGQWGKRSWLDRLLARSGTAPGGPFWPKEERRTLVPILAIDAFLEWLVAQGLRREERGANDGARTRHDATPEPDACGVGDMDDSAPPDRRAWPAGARPLVSVIVVNWNGREYLPDCFGSLAASDYPRDRLELICVDNGSTDDSRELLASGFPDVKVVALAENRGFTGGNRAGVAAARGDVLVFLNNDMRVEPDAVRRLVESIDARHPCAAARVLNWDGRRVDFVRGTACFEGRGFQENYGAPLRPEFTTATETFFANGGCFAVTRDVYHAADGFDEDFFAYYDDVDFGWAIRLLGYDIRVVGEAVAYHRHGATSRRQPSLQKHFVMDRNALWTVLKRYEGRSLNHVLGPVLLLAVRRIADVLQLDHRGGLARTLAPFSSRCRRWRDRGPWRAQEVYRTRGERTASRRGAAGLRRFPVEAWAAVGAGLEKLPAVAARRRAAQARRAVPDADVLPHLGRPFEYARSTSSYRKVQDALVEAFALRHVVKGRPRVLFVTGEPLTEAASGPAMDLLRLGRALSRRASVTIASPACAVTDDRCVVAPYSPGEWDTINHLVVRSDVMVLSPEVLFAYQGLQTTELPIAVDLRASRADDEGIGPAARFALVHGDFFLVADERARDYWLGALHTLGRVNPFTYATDPTLRSFVDVLPARAVAGDALWARGVGTLAAFCTAAELAPDRGLAAHVLRRRLEEGFRVSKWLKRAGLSLGVSEARIELVKALRPVRFAMRWRDRLAYVRARAAVARSDAPRGRP